VGQFRPKVEDDILQTLLVYLYTYCDVIGLQSYRIRWNNAVQGHSRSPISVPIESRMWLPISD